MKVISWTTVFVIVAVILVACGGSGGGSGSTNTNTSKYFPHSVGDTWTYTGISNPADHEIYTIASSSGNNQYKLNIANSDATSEEYLVQIGTKTIDIISYTSKDSGGSTTEVKTCSPHFPLMLVNPAPGDTYSRTYTCTTTNLVSNTTTTLTQTKTIGTIGYETVTTPAGNFSNALKTTYSYDGNQTLGYVWEAEGIGKVKELYAGSTTNGYELSTYTVH